MLAFGFTLLLPLLAAIVGARKVTPSRTGQIWVDTWASMLQLTEPQNLPSAPYNSSAAVFVNSTIRQTIHTSIGGDQIRIRISNAFGTTDLPITAVTVALPASGQAGSSAIQTSTLQTVTFSGQPSFIVPNGALVVSDPLNFKVQPQSILTITIYLQTGQQGNSVTSHTGSRMTSWWTLGNQVSAANLTGDQLASAAHWYFLSAVEAWVPQTTSTLAIVGDSITDGRGSDDNKNNRWPDLVLAKMQANPSTANIAVVNQAANGNRILIDSVGPNALGRIDRDVLSHSGIKYAMIFEGVNDIGKGATTIQAQQQIGDQLITAYQQIISRIHSFGIPIFGATITPFCGPGQIYPDPTREQTRLRVNNWIKTSGAFDAVVDFDAILRDPKNVTQLNPLYDSGDYLHPNVAGYQAIANAFPLDIFTRFSGGVDRFD